MFETDVFGLEAMNRRFMYEFSSSSVSALNGFMLGGSINETSNGAPADSFFYDDGFEDGDDDDGSLSDCSTNYSYGSDQEGAGERSRLRTRESGSLRNL